MELRGKEPNHAPSPKFFYLLISPKILQWKGSLFSLHTFTLLMCKKLMNRNLIQRKSRDQKGALCDPSEAQQEEARVLFFPSKDSANEKHRALGLLQPSQLPFLLYKSILLSLPRGDLPESCHDCRLWNAFSADPI